MESQNKTIPICEECKKSTSNMCNDHLQGDMDIIEYYVNGECPIIDGDKRVIINPPNN